MREIGVEVEPVAHGVVVITARVPARMCGSHNLGCAEHLRSVIRATSPDAFDPVPEGVAQAVVRDVIPQSAGGVNLQDKPPNCDGNRPIPRASFPPYVDDREDDEGEAIHGYPPGVACSITGECE